MKNATRWLSILAIFVLAACNPPEPGGDLEQLPQPPEFADVPDLNLPPDPPVFMHAILQPQPGEVIRHSPYKLIYYGTSFGGIDHFEVWVDGALEGVSPIMGTNTGGGLNRNLFYSEFEWTPASQGDHTLAMRAVGAGVNNFSDFLSVEVTVDILPSIPGETAPGVPDISLLPPCTPADLEAPAIIAPQHYAMLPDEVADAPAPVGLLQWANTAGCIPDMYLLILAHDPYFSDPFFRTADGSTTSWPVEGEPITLYLFPGTQYYWYIYASVDGANGPAAPPRSFFTGPLCDSAQDLHPLTLLQPSVGGVVHTPHALLQWRADLMRCLPDGYRIDLQTDHEFSQAVRSTILTSPQTSWLTPELEDCTTYFWRVAALKDRDAGPFSFVNSFTTDFGGACAESIGDVARVTALIDQACYLGPNSARYSIAGYLLAGETATIMAQDLSGEWWAIENPDAVGTCFVRMADNEVSGDTSGLPTWRDPVIGEQASCRQDLNQSACLAAGGSWVEPLSSAPYCDCP